MNWSMNEVEAMTRKAVRGVGYSWGLAEEGGRAVRWLCEHGLPGTEAALAFLTWRDQCGFGTESKACGLVLGTGLSDQVIGAGRLEDVSFPVLLLPFLAWRAEAESRPWSMTWIGGKACVTGTGRLFWTGAMLPEAATVKLAPESLSGAPVSVKSRAEAPAKVMAGLAEFAARTYAPATEASRRTGAGAGLADND